MGDSAKTDQSGIVMDGSVRAACGLRPTVYGLWPSYAISVPLDYGCAMTDVCAL